MPEGSPVTVIERLRYVDDEPWVYVVTHVPQHLAPGLIGEDLRTASLYAVLEQRWEVRLSHGRRFIEATVAGAPMARRLGIGRSTLFRKMKEYGFDDPTTGTSDAA